MYTAKFLARVRTELEAPRHERPFGSGWLSGSLGILAGGTASYGMDKHAVAYAAVGSKVARMRRQRSSEQTVDNSFTTEEREAMQ